MVPLSRQALALIEELRPLTGQFELMFPSARHPHDPMSENAILYLLYRLGYRHVATGHGFRTAASTWLNESGFPADHIEMQLAHFSGGVRAVYNRAQYLPGRRILMQSWADHVDQLQGSNVVPLAPRSRA